MRKLLALIPVLLALAPAFSATYYFQIINPNPYDLTNFQIKLNISKYGITPPIASIKTLDGQIVPFCYEQPNGECNQTIPANFNGIIWLKVPLIKSKNYTVIKIVTDGVTNGAVDGSQVFDFYDDFNDGVIDTNKWIPSIEIWLSDTNYFRATETNGYLKVESTENGNRYGIITTEALFHKGQIVEWFIPQREGANTILVIAKDYGYDTAHGYELIPYDWPHDPHFNIYEIDGGQDRRVYSSTDIDEAPIFAYIIYDYNGIIRFGTKDKGVVYKEPSFLGDTNYHIGMYTFFAGYYLVDWLRVRKYADLDPIIIPTYSKYNYNIQSYTTNTTTFKQTYLYVRNITITPTNKYIAINNIAIPIVINTQELISQGKMKPDCSDIYITYYDPIYGEQPVPFWVDPTTCNTPNTIIWVKVPRLSVSNDILLYLYYGSPNAIPVSDPYNTFTFFVDFSNPQDIQKLKMLFPPDASYSLTASGMTVTTGSSEAGLFNR